LLQQLIEIHFNKTNHICGARIRTYLLEKSRVVSAAVHRLDSVACGTRGSRLLCSPWTHNPTTPPQHPTRNAPLHPPLQVHQLKGERSFHIFYQLVRAAGKDKALKAALRLPTKPQEFAYLAKSGCVVSRSCEG
jgi:myosin-5